MERILAELRTVTSWFPEGLVTSLRWTPVEEHTLDDVLARVVSTFSPVFLPIFESDGDVIALHVRPFVEHVQASWFKLPHDAAEPILLATNAEYLPRCLVRDPSYPASSLPEVWAYSRDMATRLKAAPLPIPEDYIAAGLDPFHQFRVRLDPLDTACRLSNALQPPLSRASAQQLAERFLVDAPADPYTLAAAAQSRALDDPAAGMALARRVFGFEITYGYPFSLGYFVIGLRSSAEVLETMRNLIVAFLDEDDPLAPLRDQPLNKRRGAQAMRTVAQILRAAADDLGALTFLRNGAAIAGVAGAGLSKAWCEELAEQAERVEPGGLSADLARHAARVFDRGP